MPVSKEICGKYTDLKRPFSLLKMQTYGLCYMSHDLVFKSTTKLVLLFFFNIYLSGLGCIIMHFTGGLATPLKP